VYVEGGIEEGYAVSPEGFAIIAADPAQRRIFCDCALDFRAFLDHWTFIPAGKPPMLLGPNVWRSQRTYAAATVTHASIYFPPSGSLRIALALMVGDPRLTPPGTFRRSR
jgi:hypothetical protein